jgi:isopentenyl diphosphate isomerase/L-lactate dehydrogenase-like FMN-dependent dehydrogenase
LAFGASLVDPGRPILYGLAAEVQVGVYNVINEITEEGLRLISHSPTQTGTDNTVISRELN